MKTITIKNVLIVFLFITISAGFIQAQEMKDTISVIRNTYFIKGKNLKPRQLINLMNNYPKAYEEMQIAKYNYDGAQALGMVGGFCIGFPIGQTFGGVKPNWAIAGAGVALLLISIPLQTAYNMHTKAAIKLYNSVIVHNQKQRTGIDRDIYLGMSKNGFGIILHL